jgi:Family of unknown function (DUF6166)
MTMKRYHGYRQITQAHDGTPTTSTCVVQVSNDTMTRRRPLRLRNDIREHSVAFEWGYGGSGPAQLALALVADCCGRKFARPAVYQRVKAKLVARLPHDGWTLTAEQVTDAVTEALTEETNHLAAQMHEPDGLQEPDPSEAS